MVITDIISVILLFINSSTCSTICVSFVFLFLPSFGLMKFYPLSLSLIILKVYVCESTHILYVCINIGLSKKFFLFLNKNKSQIFHFQQELHWTIYLLFCSNLLPFFRQLHNSVFPKHFIFLHKELFQMPFTVFEGVEFFFPLREFCNDWNKEKFRGTTSGEYGGWIWTSQPGYHSFCRVIKKTHVTLSWGKIMHFLLINSGHFSWSATFSQSNWKQYLLEFIVWFSWKDFLLEVQSHHVQNINFLRSRSAFGAVGGGSFHLLHDFFCFMLLYSILSNFLSPVTICFKNGAFSLFP